MGTHLAPVLTKIFMGFHESKWLDDILAAFGNEQDSLKSLRFLNDRHLNIEKQINLSMAFLDVFISGINNQNLTLQTYHKSACTGLLLNLKSFASFSSQISLIKCLIDSQLKIRDNSNSFHNDIIVKKYLDYKFPCNQNQLKGKSDVNYFKLPYIGNLLHHAKVKLLKLSKEFFKENFNIKLVFNSFRVKNYSSYNDPILDDLKSFLVYKFTCLSSSSSYIGETCRHFKIGIEEHTKKDNKSHIIKHLHSITTSFD